MEDFHARCESFQQGSGQSGVLEVGSDDEVDLFDYMDQE